MATIRTKADLYDLGNTKTRLWKSLTISTGDVLVAGVKDVWAVLIQDETKWAAPGWTVATVNSVAQITFTLSAPYTGRVYVIGR